MTFLNELGLDPGLDHMISKKLIDTIHAQNGSITDFISWCGGLPAPEVSNNPFGYKFSWSPRGVLTAAMNPAIYLKNGKTVEIKAGSLLKHAEVVDIFKGFRFEGLPNRDSLKYIEKYGLKKDCLNTMFRGTLRYDVPRDFIEIADIIGFLPFT